MKTYTDRKGFKDHVGLVAKGLAMGAADVVPGVSGGTIAFITGIYNELIHSLKNCTPVALALIPREGWSAFWRHINGNFLLAVFGGIVISVKTLATGIRYAMEHHPVLLWAFFTGLIASSVILLCKHQTRWRAFDLLMFAVGTAFVVMVSVAKPAQIPASPFTLFVGGFVAICAMILPGISGSFILLLVGLYPVFLQAIIDVDIVLLLAFVAGCALGLMAFSRVLAWLLDHYWQATIACLIGFLVGSLNVTWPWKIVTVVSVNRHGKEIPLQLENVWPGTYAQFHGLDPQVSAAIGFCLLGVALVLLTETLAAKLAKKS